MYHTGFPLISPSLIILKLEWTVFPSGSKVAEIYDDVTDIANFFQHIFWTMRS